MIRITRFSVLAVFALAVLLPATSVRANHPQVKSCSIGHWYFKNSETPMVEAGGTAVFDIPQSTAWTTILQSCDNELGPSTPTMTYNATYRHWLMFKSTTVPVGTPYEVEVATVKNAVARVHRVISKRIQHLSTESQPHTEYLAALLDGLTGDNGYRIRMRVLGTGTGTVHLEPIGNFATIQGSRTEFGGSKNGYTNTITLDTTWREIQNVTLQNYSGAEVDIQLHGHLTVLSGTPGTRISIGIGKEFGSSGNHYSRAVVPNALPEEITVLDYMPNEGVGDALLPNGATILRMWAKVDSGTIAVGPRLLEVMGMDAAPVNDTMRFYKFNAGPVTLAEDTTQAQPQACILVHNDGAAHAFEVCNTTMVWEWQDYKTPLCGRWTKLLEGTIPPNPLYLALIGAGHIEITGKSCRDGTLNCWSSGATRMHVAIETVAGDNSAAADFHYTAFSVASLPAKIHFFSDSFHWGNATGQTIRLWVRLIDEPCNDVSYGAMERRLTIGRSYLGLRFFYPTGTLYNPLM